MRGARLVLAIALTIATVPLSAHAAFSCFVTARGERRCACVGGADCIDLQKSGSCKSHFKCDDSELGALICSCQASRSSKAN